MKKSTLLAVLGSLSLNVAADFKPGDSVDSGRLRGNSSMPLENSSMNFYPLLADVNLGSQHLDEAFVRYGPFINTSAHLLRIIVRHSGGRAERGLYAEVSGGGRTANADSIEFIVRPGETFIFGAKDYARFSLEASRRGLLPEDVGMPPREAFVSPKGKFAYCINFPPVEYYYEAGSMSDRSHRLGPYRDSIFTTGDKPVDLNPQCGIMETPSF